MYLACKDHVLNRSSFQLLFASCLISDQLFCNTCLSPCHALEVFTNVVHSFLCCVFFSGPSFSVLQSFGLYPKASGTERN